jgi:hypothetical protein
MDLREMGWGGVDWIGLAQDRNRWRALVNSVMNLRVPQNAGKLSSDFIVGECILLRMYQISKYIQPSFATVLERALLYTYITKCFSQFKAIIKCCRIQNTKNKQSYKKS